MFHQALSLWKRLLIGQSLQLEVRSKECIDRRKSYRMAKNDLVLYRHAGIGGEQDRVGSLSNISFGGFSMIVDESEKAGCLLSVQIGEHQKGQSTRVLAYVVHVRPLNRQKWLLGCAFSGEVRNTGSVSSTSYYDVESAEKRTRQRLSCRLDAAYKVLSQEMSATKPAEVVNISVAGVGLQVGEPLEIGNLLHLDLFPAKDGLPVSILACIIHVQPSDCGYWEIGCSFINEIAECELHRLFNQFEDGTR